MEKKGLHGLSLVFSPISNQEAEWLWNDEEVRNEVRGSKLYMIGHRPEVFFRIVVPDRSKDYLEFALESGTTSISAVKLPLDQFAIPEGLAMGLELGPKLIRIWAGKPGTKVTDGQLIHWFTPARLFHYYSRGEIKAVGLEGFRVFTEFALYYVGISKKTDSFSRLFATAHEKRSRILGNETQMRAEARLTDELSIFLFRVDALQITTYTAEDFADDNLDKLDLDVPEIPQDALAADAEKAFVNILESRYNTQRYPSYPKSSDGLWEMNFKRYGYFINETISFRTQTDTLWGERALDHGSSGDADLILVEGEKVALIKSRSRDSETKSQST